MFHVQCGQQKRSNYEEEEKNKRRDASYLDTYYPEGKGKSPDRKKQTEKMREFIYRQYFQEF